MSEEAKKIGESIANACNLLPESERKYLLGYGDGVAAMAGAGKIGDPERRAPRSQADAE